MKLKLARLLMLTGIVVLSTIPTSHAGVFLFGLFNKEKLKQTQTILQTFGPAALTCYDKLTPEELNMAKMQQLIKTGELQTCLQEEAAATAESLHQSAQTVHR